MINACSFKHLFNKYYRYQNELPKRIKQRGKNAHLVHEELVQAMKWKQSVSIRNAATVWPSQIDIKRWKSKFLFLFFMQYSWEWIFGSIQRGKFYPQLSYLIKVNTPRAVMQETKKAFRKLPNLEQALTALSNLKGVGITMASALLAAAAPDSAPFMADECKWWCLLHEMCNNIQKMNLFKWIQLNIKLFVHRLDGYTRNR